ncbi:MAG: antibiotic biosynthesis monooxygenase [Patescibacteria group bacterium]|nr:antibiotic biosynthesis monooxygenase [Patescibacteria group bacterium]
MIAVCVHVQVAPEHIAQFIQATKENHRNTIREPGALRFDVLQQADDPARFVLYEVYRDQGAVDAHKTTDHYAKWRDAVAEWMAEPRRGIKHNALFPADADAWKTVK